MNKTEQQMTTKDLIPQYDFIGKEKDLEDYILENINEISNNCKWGDILRIERQFQVPIAQGKVIVLRLCVCLPLAQGFNLTTNLMGQIAQNRCYTLGRLFSRDLIYSTNKKTKNERGQKNRIIQLRQYGTYG